MNESDPRSNVHYLGSSENIVYKSRLLIIAKLRHVLPTSVSSISFLWPCGLGPNLKNKS